MIFKFLLDIMDTFLTWLVNLLPDMPTMPTISFSAFDWYDFVNNFFDMDTLFLLIGISLTLYLLTWAYAIFLFVVKRIRGG